MYCPAAEMGAKRSRYGLLLRSHALLELVTLEALEGDNDFDGAQILTTPTPLKANANGNAGSYPWDTRSVPHGSYWI